MSSIALLLLGFEDTYSPSEEEIKEAYKKMSLKLHPDTGGSTFLFRALTLAKDEALKSVINKPAKTTYGFYTTGNPYTEAELKVYTDEIFSVVRKGIKRFHNNRYYLKNNIIEIKSSVRETVKITVKYSSDDTVTVKDIGFSGSLNKHNLVYILTMVSYFLDSDKSIDTLLSRFNRPIEYPHQTHGKIAVTAEATFIRKDTKKEKLLKDIKKIVDQIAKIF